MPSPTPSPTPSATPSPVATPLPGASGFTPGSSASPRGVEVRVADDGTFDPNIIWVAEGETVTFRITNTGAKEHGFTVGPLAGAFAADPASTVSTTIPAGMTGTVTYTFAGGGPFAFASHAGDDFAAGQVGYIVAVGPGVVRVGTETNPRLVPLKVAADGFNRPTIVVTRGETVTFLISNVGAEPHEFVVGPADKVAANAIDQITVVTTGPIAGGHVKPLTYTFPASGGTYGFASHLPGDVAGATGSILFR